MGLSAFVSAILVVINALVDGEWSLLAARFFLGVSMAGLICVIPVYIAEVIFFLSILKYDYNSTNEFSLAPLLIDLPSI